MLSRALACAAMLYCLMPAARAAAAPEAEREPARQAADAQEPRFDIFEYEVKGNRSLPETAIERAVYPFLGEKRSFKDVEAARTALERSYRDAGLQAIVEIPEQQVNGGVVRFNVTEGRIGSTRVVGSRYYSQGRILSQAPSMAAGQSLNVNRVQQDMKSLNGGAGKTIVPVLRPGKEFGTTDIDLKVDDQLPLHGGIELNNRYSPNTSELRLLGNVRYDNVWQLEHSFGAQYQVSPLDTTQVKVLALSYFAPVRSLDSYVGGYYINSRSNVLAVGDVGVLGKGDVVGLRWIKPLGGEGGNTQSLSFGLDYKHFTEDVNQSGTAAQQTPIEYMPLTAGYNATLQGLKGQTDLFAGLTFGVDGLVNRQDQFAVKRFNGQASFAYFKAEAKRTQRLSETTRLALKVDGQLTGQPLISNEQYVAGGIDSVRGYLEAEALGDSGVRGSVELIHSVLGEPLKKWLQQAEVLAFFDTAYLRTIDPLPGSAASQRLSGAGIGLRATAFDYLTLRLELGWPLVATQATTGHDPRIHFIASYSR